MQLFVCDKIQMACFQKSLLKHVCRRGVRDINSSSEKVCLLSFVYCMCRQYHLFNRKLAVNSALRSNVQNYRSRKTFVEIKSLRFLSSKSNKSYYEVLGVKPNATQNQIKSAYYMLSKIHHPDIKKDDEKNVLFLEITEAYEVLGNIQKRRMYDRGIYKPQQHLHEKEDNYEDDGQEENFKSDAFRTKQRPIKRKIYTGRSKIYDFDEHYRQHYRGLWEKKAKFDYNKEKETELKKEGAESTRNDVSLGLLVVFMCIFCSILKYI